MNKCAALNPPYCLDEFNTCTPHNLWRGDSPGSQYPDSNLCYFPMPFFISRRQIHTPFNFRLRHKWLKSEKPRYRYFSLSRRIKHGPSGIESGRQNQNRFTFIINERLNIINNLQEHNFGTVVLPAIIRGRPVK